MLEARREGAAAPSRAVRDRHVDGGHCILEPLTDLLHLRNLATRVTIINGFTNRGENVGMWRSLVARYLGEVEVTGSNPVIPTSDQRVKRWSSYFRRIQKEAAALADTPYSGDYVVIRALENGVQVNGMTRGPQTRFHHAEKLDKSEVMIAQFTEHTSAIKIRGKAVIYTRYGIVRTDEDA